MGSRVGMQVESSRDLRAAALFAMGLLFLARNDTLHGIFLDHVSWGPKGMRLFEAKHKKHGDLAGARVMFTPWATCKGPLTIIKKWTDYLEYSTPPGQRWSLWRLPTGGATVPTRADLLEIIKFAVQKSGCHVPFGFRVDLHMLRATGGCHGFALRIPPPTLCCRGGWDKLSSLDAYARPVISGNTAFQFFGHLLDVLCADVVLPSSRGCSGVPGIS